jgi:hypothetical protein
MHPGEHLSETQAAELLDLLEAPVTHFDCGQLCAPGNGGVPVCCHAASVVPVLYEAELRVLQRRSRLWRRYEPGDAKHRAMVQEARPGDAFCVCRGVEHCERGNRSLACRTFPFEPYLDRESRLVGLVYGEAFRDLCPLVAGFYPVRGDFVDQCLRLWERTFALSSAEREFYADHSRALRRSKGQRHQTVRVLTREGWREYPAGRRRSTSPSRKAHP